MSNKQKLPRARKNYTAATFRSLLESTIDEAVEDKEYFVKENTFVRNRKLPLDRVLQTCLLFGRDSINSEIIELTDGNPDYTDAALYKARKNIDPSAFAFLFYRCNARVKPYTSTRKKHQFFAFDGTQVRFRANEQEPETQRKTPHDKYNSLVRIDALLDTERGTIWDVRLCQGGKTGESASLIDMLESDVLPENSVTCCDRYYAGLVTIKQFIDHKRDFIIRLKDPDSDKAFLHGDKSLPKGCFDIIKTWHLYDNHTKEARKDPLYKFYPRDKLAKLGDKTPEGYVVLTLRIVRTFVQTEEKKKGEFVTLATSLSREEVSAREIKKDYEKRWSIENAFRQIKYYCELVYFHSHQIDLCMQEIWCRLIMFNLTRLIVSLVGRFKKKIYKHKANFKRAIDMIRNFVRRKNTNTTLMDYLKKNTVPERKGRSSARKKIPSRILSDTYR